MRTSLAILPGISSDDTTFASEGRWSDGNNMRPWRGSMQTIGGWSYAIDAMDGVCRSVLPWTDTSGNGNIAFGTNTKLYVYYDGTLSDITPSSGFTAGAEDGAGGPGYGAGNYDEGDYGEPSVSNYFPATWSLANWGESLMACPRYQTLFLWENVPATPAAAVANAPDNIVYMMVTPERQVLALGCNEEVSGDFNPMCIRGSDVRDYTNWTTSSASSAFEFILSGSGRIVAGRQVGSYVAVWTDNALYIGEFVGLDNQIYRFDKVADHCGLAGPNAAQVLGQTAYWVTPDYQFYAWTPGGQPVLLDCPIRNEFRDNIAQAQYDKIAATSVSQYGEVWWFYPDARDGLECSRYVALSTLNNAWFKGTMARSAGMDAGPMEYPIFVTPEGAAYWHENGNSANGGALDWSLTSADMYVEEAGRSVLILGCWPDFEAQQGAASLALTLRAWPQTTTTYSKGPYALTVNKQKYDFRAQGRIVNLTLSGSSAPAFVRLGKLSFDTVPGGER